MISRLFKKRENIIKNRLTPMTAQLKCSRFMYIVMVVKLIIPCVSQNMILGF